MLDPIVRPEAGPAIKMDSITFCEASVWTKQDEVNRQGVFIKCGPSSTHWPGWVRASSVCKVKELTSCLSAPFFSSASIADHHSTVQDPTTLKFLFRIDFIVERRNVNIKLFHGTPVEMTLLNGLCMESFVDEGVWMLHRSWTPSQNTAHIGKIWIQLTPTNRRYEPTVIADAFLMQSILEDECICVFLMQQWDAPSPAANAMNFLPA